VLQSVAECCSVLPCVAVCCSVLRCVAVCCGVESSHTHSQWPKRTTHTHFDVANNKASSRTHSQRSRRKTHLGRVATRTQTRSPIHPHTLAESSRTHCQWRRRRAPHCCPSPPFPMHINVCPAKWPHSDGLSMSYIAAMSCITGMFMAYIHTMCYIVGVSCITMSCITGFFMAYMQSSVVYMSMI